MKMRDENLEIIERNMFLPEEQQKPLTPKQQQMLEQVKDCYHLQLQKPMLSRSSLRDYLVKNHGISKEQAYRIIYYAEVVLGNVKPTHKNWIRHRIEYISEQAYISIEAKDYKRADALTKLGGMLAKAFNTNVDEGELINAQKYLDIETVNVVMDPAAIGIKVSEATQKQIDLMLKKYHIEDAEVEEIKEDET